MSLCQPSVLTLSLMMMLTALLASCSGKSDAVVVASAAVGGEPAEPAREPADLDLVRHEPTSFRIQESFVPEAPLQNLLVERCDGRLQGVVTDAAQDGDALWVAVRVEPEQPAGLPDEGGVSAENRVYLVRDGMPVEQCLSRPVAGDEFHVLTTDRGCVYVFSSRDAETGSGAPEVWRVFQDRNLSNEKLSLPKFVGFPSGYTCFSGYGRSESNTILLPTVILKTLKWLAVDFDAGTLTVRSMN